MLVVWMRAWTLLGDPSSSLSARAPPAIPDLAK